MTTTTIVIIIIMIIIIIIIIITITMIIIMMIMMMMMMIIIIIKIVIGGHHRLIFMHLLKVYARSKTTGIYQYNHTVLYSILPANLDIKSRFPSLDNCDFKHHCKARSSNLPKKETFLLNFHHFITSLQNHI